jgi:NADPH:quinone reductase-like Zn-dependent oxidoreductase
MYGHYGTTLGGQKNARPDRRLLPIRCDRLGSESAPQRQRVLAFQVAKLRDRHAEWFRQDANALFELLEERKIEPLVSERIPLVDARRAHENLGQGGITGKQVLICDERLWEEQNATAEPIPRKAVS